MGLAFGVVRPYVIVGCPGILGTPCPAHFAFAHKFILLPIHLNWVTISCCKNIEIGKVLYKI